MKLFTKLKQEELIHDLKEYSELIWIRCIRINDNIIIDPNPNNIIIKKGDKIQIGFKIIFV